MSERGGDASGRLSAQLARRFVFLAAAPLFLSAGFFLAAARSGWITVSSGASTALALFGLLLLAGGVTAALAVHRFLYERVSSPLEALTERAAQLADGEAPVELPVHAEDEVGQATATLNWLAERLAVARGQFAEQIEGRSRELGRALGELQLLKRLNEAIVHNIPSGIALLALDGRVLYFNSSFEHTWGISPADLGQDLRYLGESGPLGEIDWPAELAQLRDGREGIFGVTAETGEWPRRRVLRYSLISLPPVDLDVPLRLVGDEFCLNTLSPPNCEQDCTQCFAHSASWAGRHALLLIDDITEQRNLETQLIQSEKLAALGQLSAGIAHEIRNPLSAISGAAYYIGDVLTDDQPELSDVGEYVALIQRNVDRAQRTVNDILSFSRPSGASPADVDLSELARQTLTILDKSIVDQGVVLDCDLGDGIAVHCRPETVKQALVNLLVNALQAMPDGGKLTLRATRDGQGRPTLLVSDTGTGIRQEDLRHIFNPFFTTKPPGQGTGLGLSIARQAIEADGGRLEVESEVGRGTTFRIVWPVAAPSEAEAMAGGAG